ncbi:actin binding Rho activating protein b [Lampris incognitus]|uniref:actin binding Rho activating protein b n=1 Tax=Lampris incognitus TaxID=2546036 RepID=UPI0024B4CB31|nr:actin binding Rho activating protein b [Lampris incognitus]
MSETQTMQRPMRKPSTNKNIEKLRTISMVCCLTQSWQQLVTENEQKQASEPCGWMGGPAEESKKPWTPQAANSSKEAHPNHNQLTPTSQNHITDSGDAQKIQTSPQESQNTSQTEAKVEPATLPLTESCIKTKQAVKSVTAGMQEKSGGVGYLTEKISNEALPSGEEINKMLSKQSSPTCHRKCSNIVSSLTKSWKEVEKEQKYATEGGGLGEERSCSVLREDVEDPDPEKKSQGAEAAKTERSEAENEELPEGDSETAIKIKRPSALVYRKEAEDANKINALSMKYSTVGSLKSRWQNWASEHTVNQKLNPFSEEFDYEYSMSLRLHKGQEGYGHPKEGSKTAERAKRAEQHIHREIGDMCYVIRTMADPDPDGKSRVTFGHLFDRYVRISDKVVGILMRARKHGKVAFEGEMLWQGRDDAVIITLLV